MKTRDYDNYYIPDLIADLRDDACELKNKLELYEKLRRFFGIFSIVWSYVSIALFTAYGVMHLLRTGEFVLPIISFAVCGIFFIVNTVMLALRGRSEAGGRHYAEVRRVFRLVTVALKIAMTAITIASLVGIADDPSVGLRTTWCVLSTFWLGMTVAVDVASFFVRRVLRMLKEIAAERVRRAKAAFTNTASDVVKIARTVKDIGSGIKKIFAGKTKNAADDAPTEQNNEDENDFFVR